jgi:hypothetical protein
MVVLKGRKPAVLPRPHGSGGDRNIGCAPKAKSGTSPKDTDLKYTTIALLVKIVSRDYGFPEYSNPEHRGNPDAPMSACGLVADELGLSERTVEEIWADRKAMVTRPRCCPN